MKTRKEVEEMLNSAVSHRKDRFAKILSIGGTVTELEDVHATTRIFTLCEVLGDYQYNPMLHRLDCIEIASAKKVETLE